MKVAQQKIYDIYFEKLHWNTDINKHISIIHLIQTCDIKLTVIIQIYNYNTNHPLRTSIVSKAILVYVLSSSVPPQQKRTVLKKNTERGRKRKKALACRATRFTAEKPNYLQERFPVASSPRLFAVYSRRRQPGVSTYRRVYARTHYITPRGNPLPESSAHAHHKRFGEVAAEQTVRARSSLSGRC